MLNSSLFDETTLYQQFTRDLLRATREVIIESSYITNQRMRLDVLHVVREIIDMSM